MACFKPITAWQPDEGGQLVFAAKRNHREIEIPCGQCIGCRADRAEEWGVRITHEAKLYDHSCWLTLTYGVRNPVTLIKSDLQKFHRALRDKYRKERKIRWFGVGEYGEQNLRPHYHTVIFNFWPPDAKPWDSKSYRSEILDKVWGHGFVDVRHLNWERALYLGKYSMKKIGGAPAKEHYTRLDPETGDLVECIPEFAHMSLKPGIGQRHYEKFKSDFLPCDHVVIDGRKRKVPKAYWRKFLETDAEAAETLHYERIQKGKLHTENNTRERLAVREEFARLKSENIKRSL